MPNINLGIDIDGTLSKYPEFFITLGRLWRSQGNRVYIITGLGHEKALERLSKYPDDFYDQLVDTSLYNQYEKNLIGHTPSNEDIVGRFKQRKCKELDIEIMFDDQAAIHRQYGSTPIFEVK